MRFWIIAQTAAVIVVLALTTGFYQIANKYTWKD